MTKNGVTARFGAMGMAMTVALAAVGFSQSARAQMVPLSSSFEKADTRAVSSKKKHADRSTRGGKKSTASRRAGKAKYAGKSRPRNKVASSGGNRGSLMATLAAVKPAGLPLSLAAAVITQESGWRVNARGSSGEIGLMQLMPATARQYGGGGNLYNPANNMRVGTRVLHACYKRAGGNVAATIGCYNRGPGLMWSWNGRSITRRYVSNVHRMMARS